MPSRLAFRAAVQARRRTGTRASWMTASLLGSPGMSCNHPVHTAACRASARPSRCSPTSSPRARRR
eukprot:5895817-Pyramimonas_sp.AAC.1